MIETPEYSYSMCAFRISKKLRTGSVFPGFAQVSGFFAQKTKTYFYHCQISCFEWPNKSCSQAGWELGSQNMNLRILPLNSIIDSKKD